MTFSTLMLNVYAEFLYWVSLCWATIKPTTERHYAECHYAQGLSALTTQ